MKALKTKRVDSVLLGSAVALLIGLGLWALLGGTGDATPPSLPARGPNGVYQPAPLTNPETATDVWAAPPSSGESNEWLFDVFTPPVIYYDVANHVFSVTPPDATPGEGKSAVAAFGLELVEVKRTPYRIQLVGYVGSEGDYLATFEDVEAGTSFLARPGKTVEESGMVLRSFNVEKVKDDSSGGTTVQDTKATAIIRDLRQDLDVTLVQKIRLMNEIPTAVFRVTGELSRNVEGKQGDTITIPDGTFEIGLVTIDPPTAEVTREAFGDRPADVRRLEPVPVAAPAPVASQEPGFQFPAADPKFNPFGSP
jgi:hypothetical protein